MKSQRPAGDRAVLRAWIRANAPHVCAGIAAADAMNYGQAVAAMEDAGLDFLHFDIMDGVFCPQLTFGPGLVKSMRTRMLKDVHLMVADPLSHLESFITAGADILHVHAENQPHLHRVLSAMDTFAAQRPVLRGVAINPGTPVACLNAVLPIADLITVLAVDPGWSSTLAEEALTAKLAELRRLCAETGCDPLICIDGGITPATYPKAAALKPDLVVSGSALFRQGASVAENLSILRGR